MNNPTKLLKTDIIAVEVPKDAFDISIGSLGHALYFSQKGKIKHINLPFGKVELLGEATEDEISFDVEPYVEKMYFDVDGRKIAYFKDYNPLKKLLHDIYCFTDKNQSFRSLLQASGFNWVNEKGVEPSHLNYKHKNQFNELVWISESHKNKYCDIYEEWKEAESKLIKGKLIFLKIIK